MIENELVLECYNELLLKYNKSTANYILTNSIAILGDKKITPSRIEELSSYDIKRINKFKYPEKLTYFIRLTSEKSDEWKNFSFSKIAFS